MQFEITNFDAHFGADDPIERFPYRLGKYCFSTAIRDYK